MSATPTAPEQRRTRHPGRARLRIPRRGDVGLVLAVAAVAVGLAPVAVTVPLPVLVLALAAIGLVTLAYAHPPAAAYLVIGATPLLAGLTRDAYLPLLRPHEALGVLLGAGVALRALTQVAAGHRLPWRLTRIDGALLLLVAASSVLPLLWLAVRGLAPTPDDLLYAAAIGKFAALYLLVRCSVHTERQVARALLVALTAGAVVAVVAIAQSLQIADVPRLLAPLYPTEDPGGITIGRGPSTLGSSIAVGDVMAFNLAVCLGWMLRSPRSRPVLVPAVALFTAGALAAGQFSAMIALVVAVFAVAYLTGHVRRLFVVLLPAGLLGAAVLWPVIQARIADFAAPAGLPRSWQVRLDNLRGIVWPELFADHRWLLGVRPAARIRMDMPWGQYVYLESGHTWLLWTGGVPFVMAFLYFVWVALRGTAGVARHGAGAVGVAAVGSFASLVVVFVLMSLDPHITMRGTADLLFSLLALAMAVPIARARRAAAHATGAARRPAPTSAWSPSCPSPTTAPTTRPVSAPPASTRPVSAPPATDPPATDPPATARPSAADAGRP